jgi:hypothetical protein
MKKKSPILLILAIFLISSCASINSRAERNIGQDGWPGVYAGIIPAADGPGIDVTLILRSNETYVLVYYYIDRAGENIIQSGRLNWNPATNIIRLDIDNFPSFYEAGRDALIQLDMAGRRVTGELAGNYILRRLSP